MLGPVASTPTLVVVQAPSTKEEVFGAARRTVRGLVRRVQVLYVRAEMGGERAVLAGGRGEGWRGWVVENKGEEEMEEEEEEGMGGYE